MLSTPANTKEFAGRASPAMGRSGVRKEIPWLNSWLLVLLLMGSVIVAADGFTRPPDLEDTPPEASGLQYDPLWSAYVLATISLPLCYLYFSTIGASRKEILLAWFVLNTVAYKRDFSYIRIWGMPVFVTDVTLALFLWSFVRHSGCRWLRLGRWHTILLTTFAVVGVLCVARGWSGHLDKLFVLRDFAIVVYVLFVFVGFHVVRTWDAVRRLFLAFALGSIFATLSGSAWFIAEPDQRRFIAYGLYALAVFLGSFILTSQHIISRSVGWSITCVFGIGVLLCNARTLDVGLVLALLLVFLVPPSAQKERSIPRLKILLASSVVAVCLAVVLAQTSAGAAFLERTEEELVSGTVNYEDDPNANFRMLAWFEAFDRFAKQPLVGEGYGVPFVFELTDADVRPHNTFLTVLYKMGLIGFVPLVLFLGYFHWIAWGTVRAFRHTRESVLLYVLLLANLVMCQFGLLNLLLESPFLASMFWLTIGVGLRMTNLLRSPSGSQATVIVNA